VRLSLERGSARGRVILRIEVRERTTFQVDNLVLGVSEGLAGSYERAEAPIVPYGGVSVSDANLLGTGDAFALSLLLSEPQQGARLRFEDPGAFGTPVALHGMAFFVHGREFFGDDDVLVTPLRCPMGDPPPCEAARAAVVNYLRGGGAIGTGLSLSPEVRLRLAYQLELVSVLSRPDAASELRGLDVVPVDFLVQDGISAVSMLDLHLVFDGRDSPALTRSGTLLYLRVDLASRLFGSDYDFFRAEGLARHWAPLPGWDHSLRVSLFAGAALDQTPFFYRFYASDLSDLVPSRMLELNLDRRGPLNLFRNAVAEHRIGQLAARLDVEYQIQLFRVDRDFRALWIYANAGLYTVADIADFQRPIRGYSGIDLLPLDLTFDVGVRIDTSVGVFSVGFSTLLGFVSVG
jgi:outer membrane protein assembly factor BamA